ncbi:prepilin-type N-terminal cleavage/methylation domain-containing protein [Candidatus Pacearchaeota archaeon]|nr:prepilin-type N-terminal cleavage/methylation domain-containing protein [Candidatus Pacearchaeota archaeon]
MRKNRGFTLVELLIVVAIIGVIGAIIFGFITFRSCASNSGEAEAEARKYAQSLGVEIKSVSCTDRDTDHDGYVSCSISYNDNGKLAITPVECATRWSTNSGCKAPRQVVRRGLF